MNLFSTQRIQELKVGIAAAALVVGMAFGGTAFADEETTTDTNTQCNTNNGVTVCTTDDTDDTQDDTSDGGSNNGGNNNDGDGIVNS